MLVLLWAADTEVDAAHDASLKSSMHIHVTHQTNRKIAHGIQRIITLWTRWCNAEEVN